MWQTALIGALAFNAVLGLGYRIYRLTRRGPLADVYGQAALSALLAGLALGVAAETSWARWGSLVYGLLFGLAVMPLWTLAVLMPLPPGRADYAFTALYWGALVVVIVAALAL